MMQEVLADRSWAKRLTKDDLWALTPLIYAHVNPYRVFLLDMRARSTVKSAYKNSRMNGRFAAGGRNVGPLCCCIGNLLL
jgi:hypothetical protein